MKSATIVTNEYLNIIVSLKICLIIQLSEIVVVMKRILSW